MSWARSEHAGGVAPGLPGAERAWEDFHENSKTSRYGAYLPDEDVLELMSRWWEVVPYHGCPVVPLPEPAPLPVSLGEALLRRHTARALAPTPPADLLALATLLHFGYGVTRRDEHYPRAFRTVPSGGAVYPLELYVHAAHVEGLDPGLYHFDPLEHALRRVGDGDHTERLASSLVFADVVVAASLVVFVTALFERSTMKYGDRGYRFVLLEAGHVAQNVNLAAAALGLGCVNLGGYFDHDVDALLGLDGLTHSTIYMVAIGNEAPPASL